MDDKTLNLMGLARRAGKLLIGSDAVCGSVKKKKTKLVFLTSDAAPAHVRKLAGLGYEGTTLHLPYTMKQVGEAVGKYACIFALEDEGFSAAVEKTSK